jgi:chloramphenicol 3-O phosphotransferase
MAAMTAGRVIVLNGTSSSGKTTLAAQLQADFAREGSCWIVIALDEFLGKLPGAWHRIGTHDGAFAEQGVVMEVAGGRIERRLGDVGEQLLTAYHDSVAGAARAGLNVIVDEVILGDEDLANWQKALAGLDVLWVRVHADPRVLDARERARRDRLAGLARAQTEVVHRHVPYGVHVDTGDLDPASASSVVRAASG